MRAPPYCCAEYPECPHWERPILKRARLEELRDLQALGTFEATGDTCPELERLEADERSQSDRGGEHG